MTAPRSLVKIVYVEDDPIDQEIFRRTFRHFEDQLYIVSSGEELEARWHELQPQLIFVDATILGPMAGPPLRQGPKVIERIRQITNNAKFPAVLVTGSDKDTAETLARQCKADGFTIKPVQLEQLFDELMKAGFKIRIVHDEIVLEEPNAS